MDLVPANSARTRLVMASMMMLLWRRVRGAFERWPWVIVVTGVFDKRPGFVGGHAFLGS